MIGRGGGRFTSKRVRAALIRYSRGRAATAILRILQLHNNSSLIVSEVVSHIA